MKNFLLSSVLLISATIGLSQSAAPGGVSSNLMLWLKADRGTSTTTDGNAVQDWLDSGPHANDAYQINASARPLYKANQFNGHPAIKNASGQYFDVDMSAVNEVDFTIFTVVKRESGDDDQYVLGIQSSPDDDGFNFGYLSSSELAFDQYTHLLAMPCPDYAGTAEIPSILIAEFNSESSMGKRQYLIRDGVSNDKKGTFHSPFYLPGDGNIGRGNGNNYFKGLIAEVIIYSGTLSDQDKKRVLTYLCVKYGLSIPVSQNVYYTNGAFPHDLFGIGKSTTHGLNQASSRSINTDDILHILFAVNHLLFFFH